MSGLKKLPAVFYATGGGREPVREWLLELSLDDRRRVGRDIATAEYGWPVGMPICKSLGRGLWEIRSELTGNRAARIIFAPVSGRMVLLHCFVKKARRAPKMDIDLAVRRLDEVRRLETH